jgi:hypothetical protein
MSSLLKILLSIVLLAFVTAARRVPLPRFSRGREIACSQISLRKVTEKNDQKRSLSYREVMIAGAVAKSVATTAVNPLNVIKTLLQRQNDGQAFPTLTWRVLSRGAVAQLLLSLPHGAISFVATEVLHLMLAVPVNHIFIVLLLSWA